MHTKRLTFISLIILLCVSACSLVGSPEMAYANKINDIVREVEKDRKEFTEYMLGNKGTELDRQKAMDESLTKFDKLVTRAANIKPPKDCNSCNVIHEYFQLALPVPHDALISWVRIEEHLTQIYNDYGK